MDQSTTMGVAHTSKTRPDSGMLLDLWSQTAPRDWVAYGLWFPHAGGEFVAKTKRALQEALDNLAELRPFFAGRLRLSENSETPGQLVWIPSTTIEATFKDISDVVTETYEDLRRKNFPPSFFVNPELFALGINPNPSNATQSEKTPPAGTNGTSAAASTPTSTPESTPEVPVIAIRGFFIKGGFIMQVFLHHTFGDGQIMDEFLKDFAAVTNKKLLPEKGERAMQLPSSFLDQLCHLSGSARLKKIKEESPHAAELVQLCPEYKFDSEWFAGPTQPKLKSPLSDTTTDCIALTIKANSLKVLKASLGRGGWKPSGYVALSTLLWAYVTLHRSDNEGWGNEETSAATLSNPANWRKCCKEDSLAEIIKDYFGNATVKCMTRVDRKKVVEAAKQATKAVALVPKKDLIKDHRLDGLRDIAKAVFDALQHVNPEFVAVRTLLYKALPDPRNLGLADDPKAPEYMQFNTWRPFGGEASFKIPGVPTTEGSDSACPERVRKVMLGKGADYRNILLMPACGQSPDTDVLISLPTVSFKSLMDDQGFMCWFEEIPKK